MYHCKVMIVDDTWVSMSSTNFASRSFRLKDEVNLNIYNRDFAVQQIEIFESGLKKSRRITYQDWKNRPWQEKVYEHTLCPTSTA